MQKAFHSLESFFCIIWQIEIFYVVLQTKWIINQELVKMKHTILRVVLVFFLYYVLLTAIVLVVKAVFYGEPLFSVETILYGILRNLRFAVIFFVLWYITLFKRPVIVEDKSTKIKRAIRIFVILTLLYFAFSLTFFYIQASYNNEQLTLSSAFYKSLKDYRSIMFGTTAMIYIILPYIKRKKKTNTSSK